MGIINKNRTILDSSLLPSKALKHLSFFQEKPLFLFLFDNESTMLDDNSASLSAISRPESDACFFCYCHSFYSTALWFFFAPCNKTLCANWHNG